MQDKLIQFEKKNNVWELVHKHRNKSILGIKWVVRNKVDEHGIIASNKARLVVKSYN